MISVVIPLYNKERYIERAVYSVLSQTFQQFEIVIVNDGSTDGSVSVIERMNNPLIRLIHQKNGGVSAARNRGIEEARFEYIAFLDADDEWKENHLEVIAGLIRKFPECGVFGTSYYSTRTIHLQRRRRNHRQLLRNGFGNRLPYPYEFICSP